MNYLAHLYLSGTSEQVIVGNFIGDFVKGKKYLDYPNQISKGIVMHRRIDSFTDKHESTKMAKAFFRNEFGLYSGIVVDFFYDHFLAKNWPDYSTITLRSFAKRMHAILLSNYMVLPRRVQGFLPFLIQNKRLESYATVDGIVQSLKIMGNYSSVPSKSEEANIILQQNYVLLEDLFNIFMKDMMKYVSSEFEIELPQPVEQETTMMSANHQRK
ncbi:ACP phosphodiesterase [Prolixibacteraceae bacterium Z1-6]|uniref:ACP phosphodiesterase n=1 Tax=Draconibacterium aestuarii TaxID=2998507 RepID=A0A9X3J951_9BACT|nr:ACP phosphodiesterase [Prolixibacteraceae bacterium Z1-6]